ncbi:hypothetical protein HU200_061973 [Digitaria exilis]|uniref:NB-ARC domain-containing protein n=1 Tax=Digitaria exilis TaxID=1010633 RepID=A0A835E0X7_9POAL|nr:hypothetical protein HU200_061973 [Digitaria exilis]
MGGLGKTTLAKMVYNDRKVQNHFELRMWHCVSENFGATAVVRSIIELATNGRCDLPDNIELLRGKMQEVIGRKRFLLILDDVWNEEQQKWEDDLKPLVCSSIGGLGSMIVVTSRSRQVASIMGTLPPHELSCLSDHDSWELFSKKASGKGVEEQEEFIAIGKLIVNKCKGLPLALNTMGGLMSSKHQIKEWEVIAESNMGGNNEVLSILKLSYMHLPSEMKQCFAFCAVFPKDYVMDKSRLESIDLVQKGESVFNELVWRSFIQDVFYHSYDGIRCKIHDLMHDLAKNITDECAFAEELIQQKASGNDVGVRHVQLSQLSLDESEQITRSLKKPSSLHTLLVELSLMDLKVKESKLTSLRAIRCEDPSVIRNNVINTTHLTYLDLSFSSMVRLPNSLCMLKLTHIYLLRCDRLKRMPAKLGRLHNLCTLTKFVVNIGDGFGIEELKDLRQLGNRLELYNLKKVKSGSKANLHEKKNLTELALYWGFPFLKKM